MEGTGRERGGGVLVPRTPPSLMGSEKITVKRVIFMYVTVYRLLKQALFAPNILFRAC